MSWFVNLSYGNNIYLSSHIFILRISAIELEGSGSSRDEVAVTVSSCKSGGTRNEMIAPWTPLPPVWRSFINHGIGTVTSTQMAVDSPRKRGSAQ